MFRKVKVIKLKIINVGYKVVNWKKYIVPKEKSKEVTVESDVKCCGFIWYVGFFCLNESRDVGDDTVALFPLFGHLNHRVLSSQATKCASSSSKVVSQILQKSPISWLFRRALIMIASPCFSHKNAHVCFFPLFKPIGKN